MYSELNKINNRPGLYTVYSAETLWNDDHISRKMLEYHLDETTELASRNIDFINEAVEWMDRRFSFGAGIEIGDFGCGPGLYSTRFAEKGARVTGIDFSKRSIQYAMKTAEEKKLPIHYIQQNYLGLNINNRFDLITMIYCDFCVLSPEQRNLLLEKIATLLKDDGLFFLDVFSLKAYDDREETFTYSHNLMDGFWSANDYYGFMNVYKYGEGKVVLDKYTIIEQAKTREVYNWLRYFSLDSLRDEFRKSGFDIIEVYSDIRGKQYNDQNETIAIAAKKLT